MKDQLWVLVNSPVFITLVASGVVVLLNKIYDRRPSWQKYQGTIIAAVRYAEKAIPDDAENKSIQRLDAALKYVLAIVEARENRVTTREERTAIEEGIQIIHDQVEA